MSTAVFLTVFIATLLIHIIQTNFDKLTIYAQGQNVELL